MKHAASLLRCDGVTQFLDGVVFQLPDPLSGDTVLVGQLLQGGEVLVAGEHERDDALLAGRDGDLGVLGVFSKWS